MNNFKFYLFCFFVCSFLHSNSQIPLNDQNWQSYFQEDFNYLNWNVWTIPESIWQPEVEKWDTSNILINNGNVELSIIDLGGNYYQLGGLAHFFQHPYGFYEIRWDVPNLVGRWISFWLCCGNTNELTQINEELDLFETTNDINPYRYHTNVHCDDGCLSMPDSFIVTQNITTTQNVYGFEWTPECLIYYFNNIPVKEIFYNTCIPRGNMDILYITPGISKECFPNLNSNSSTFIDYVKIWTLKYDVVDIVVTRNTQITTFAFSVKKTITFDATRTSLSIPLNTKNTFRATDFILIEGDFTVPIGSEMTLFIHDNPINFDY